MKNHKERKLYISLKIITILLPIFTSEMVISNRPEIELTTKGTRVIMHTIKNLLVVNASPNLRESYSRTLSNYFVEKLQDRYRDQYSFHYRDLGKEPVPCLNARNLEVILQGRAITQEARLYKNLSDTLIDDMRRAHAIILSTPMHNFTVPVSLKAYFDIVLRAGETFKFTSNGSEGMLSDRPVILITTSGGSYTKREGDFLTPYIKYILQFIGIRNVTSISAEGLAIERQKNLSLIRAKEALELYVETFHQSLT